MRKVHYRVVLDVFVHEDEEFADGNDALSSADFWPTLDEEVKFVDVMDVTVEAVEVTDSR